MDSEGNLKQFNQFVQDVNPIIGKYNKSWLRTEYDTAVIRARQAANFKKFEEDADLFPNLKWLPSTSANPREVHKVFYGIVLPAKDAFWQTHYPGDEWNCKCRITNTDDEPTERIPKANYSPSLGLDENPAFTGAVFSFSHPFFTAGYLAYKKLSPIVSKFISTYVLKRPPQFNYYIDEYKSKVWSSPYTKKEEYNDNFRVAKILADNNLKIYMLPCLDPNIPVQLKLRSSLLPQGVYKHKNPDFYIHAPEWIKPKIFENKTISIIKDTSFKGLKNSITNHIKKAKVQADNIILEIQHTSIDRKILDEVILNYQHRTKKQREIWVIIDREIIKYKTPPKRG